MPNGASLFNVLQSVILLWLGTLFGLTGEIFYNEGCSVSSHCRCFSPSILCISFKFILTRASSACKPEYPLSASFHVRSYLMIKFILFLLISLVPMAMVRSHAPITSPMRREWQSTVRIREGSCNILWRWIHWTHTLTSGSKRTQIISGYRFTMIQ